MLQNIARSYAFRSGALYRAILKNLPAPAYTSGPEAPFRFISLCGQKHLDMLNECLRSVNKTWTIRPELVIYSDGSMEEGEIRKSLRWWKGSLRTGMPDALIAWAENKAYTSLADFARKEAVGRKLTLILQEAEQGPVLWCDTDILWFRQPELPQPDSGQIILKTSEDFQPAYDPALENASGDLLKTKPFINTGLVYLNTNLMEVASLKPWTELLNASPNHFTEQTFLALAVKSLQQQIWPLSEIACFQSDKFDLSPSFPGQKWTARHYVGPVRHIFWKDALKLRFS